MQYPRAEIRKVENGYIIQQGRNEYVFDNFLEAMIVLANQYEEKDVVLNALQYCKQTVEIHLIEDEEKKCKRVEEENKS